MQRMRVRRLAYGVLVLAVALGSCKKRSTAGQDPSGMPSAPTPAGPFANVSGTWTGTLESANLPTRNVTLTAFQAADCVDGTWISDDSKWDGAISGYANADAYGGQISFERSAANGGQCLAIATIEGPVGDSTLKWTSTGFTAVGTCDGDLPQAVVLTLHR
jgi:hypothetical protein